MKKITAFLVSLFLFSVEFAYAAPTLPDMCQIFYPDILLSSPVLKELAMEELVKSSDFGQKREPKDRRFWIVYSDRDNNVTYTAPDGAAKYKTLSMNETLRIAQIKNGYALVYTEPQVEIAYPMISQHAECKGWIPMKNLLIWHSCLADDYGIYYKALLCVNLDQTTDSDLGRMFRNPTNKEVYTSVPTDMKFYFVMKREGNMALLANVYTTEGRTDQVLYGWFEEQSYVAWNQRSCLEPTWNIKDVEYFADENVSASIFMQPELETCITSIEFERKQAPAKYDPHLYRMSPDHLRFPLLDKNENLYHCSTFSAAGGGYVISNVQDNHKSDLGYSESELKELTNINIGIVIDGTSSMAPYYAAVKDAIKEGRKFFGKKYSVQVGVVIYRDYADGEYVTEVFPLTNPDNVKLDKFLDTGGDYGVKSHPSDRTLAEAMYQGIDVALEKLRFNPKQSNILLVVGDCGNDRTDNKISSDAIVDKLVSKNVNIMGFQARRKGEDAYELFNSQMIDLIRRSLESKYAQLHPGTKIQLKETKEGYELQNDAKSVLYVGSHSFPEFGQQLEIIGLSTLMQKAIMYCSESVNHQINLISQLNAGGFKASSSTVGTGIDFDEEWLKMKLGDRYESIKESNSLLSFKGYVNQTHKSGRDFFKPVIFISSDELNGLIERLAPVNEATVVQTNDREPYVNAMKALIRAMVPDVTDAEMNRYGYKEIMSLVAGLNETSGALKDYTIAEIASHEAVSHTQYISIVQDFKRKFASLQRIKNSPYKYTRVFNDLKFYWLPVEDLP